MQRVGCGGGSRIPVLVQQRLDELHLQLAWAQGFRHNKPIRRHGVLQRGRHNFQLLCFRNGPHPIGIAAHGQRHATKGATIQCHLRRIDQLCEHTQHMHICGAAHIEARRYPEKGGEKGEAEAAHVP